MFHYKHFDIQQDHAAMKVGTDSDLLGTLSLGGRRILDVGTGTGILSLMLAQRYPQATVTAIEIDPNAIIDAQRNFAASPFASRLTLHHIAFQDYLMPEHYGKYDSVVCNPPYFDKSLECPSVSRSRARHSSSLPFDVLAQGAYALLADGGTFSVCIPPEVLRVFNDECLRAGFSLLEEHRVKSIPSKPTKRYVLTYKKGEVIIPTVFHHCMRNEDRTYSDWYKTQLQDFLVATWS